MLGKYETLRFFKNVSIPADILISILKFNNRFMFSGQLVDIWKCIRSRYEENVALLLSFLVLAFWVHHREIGLRELAMEKKIAN